MMGHTARKILCILLGFSDARTTFFFLFLFFLFGRGDHVRQRFLERQRAVSPDRATAESDVRRPFQNSITVPNKWALLPNIQIKVWVSSLLFFFQPRFPIHLLSFTSIVMSSSNHAALVDRPERSRNAKAQARHRAKRKAYIEQV